MQKMQYAKKRVKDASWRRSAPSADGTHHLVDGRPLYEARFLRVLSFHAPGLAAVSGKDGAWHINGRGLPAYSRIFVETFGFYENRAAVRDGNGWFHIAPDGAAAYSRMYEWCGNFQGGRAVVRSNDGYFHILPDGRALYKNRFVYAGDFRERRAAVRMADGWCIHIDESGAPAHSRRYRDLDVYHKGFARARDDGGWTHVNMHGAPAYKRRFAALEPFYNGRALAETFGGEVITIDERGSNTGMVAHPARVAGNDTPPGHDWFCALSADMTGYWNTRAIAAAAELSVADKLPFSDTAVGDALGLPKNNARILLQSLAELNIVRLEDNVWRLTEKGEILKSDHPHSLSRAASAWADIAGIGCGAEDCLSALRGEAARKDVFSRIGGAPDKVELMHDKLAAYAGYDYESLPAALPLDGVGRLLDIGGGTGAAARLIAGAWPDVEIVVLDRPEVLATRAFARNCRGAFRGAPADIFAPLNITGDAILLARVLHDWNDADALAILRNARAALRPGKNIFIVESIKKDAAADGMSSLHLLATSGGRERTEEEYASLMAAAGFNFLGARMLRNNIDMITGTAA